MTEIYGSMKSNQLNFDFLSKRKYSILDSRSKEYTAWYNMIRRCFCEKAVFYENYGGRGITVYDRWLGFDGFDNFVKDMGVKPSNKHSLDRINNNGNYCKENCRWATAKEQARNRRDNHILIIDGYYKSIAEWADISNISGHTIKDRLDDGWDPKKAVFTDVRKRISIEIGSRFGKWVVKEICSERLKNSKLMCMCKCDCSDRLISVWASDLLSNKSTQCKSCSMKYMQSQRKIITITYNDQTHSLMEWSRILNVSHQALRKRLNKGYSSKEILFPNS